MFSRYIDNIDFKSRFRILKGGKVSLVVSAMILGSIVNVANATTYDITNANRFYSASVDGNTYTTTQDITSDVTIMSGSRDSNTMIDTTYTSTVTISNDISTGSNSSMYYSLLVDFLGSNSTVTVQDTSAITNADITLQSQYLSNSAIWMRYLKNSSTFENKGSITASDSQNLWSVNGVYLGSGMNLSSFYNRVDANISAASSNTATYALTPAIGIHLEGNSVISALYKSSIKNEGTISANSTSISSGIVVGDYNDTNGSFTVSSSYDIKDSQISNEATGEINSTSSLTQTLTSNVNSDVYLYSSGIQLGRVLTETEGTETSVKNAGIIDSKSTLELTVDGSVITKGLKAESKGIHTNYLAGDINLTEKPTLENSGSILATSKLNINFANNTGDTIDADINNYVAIATGIESNTYKALINNTSTGNITTLSEINIDSAGSVLNTYGTWSESNGMLFYGIAESTLTNAGTIDAKAIYNGIDNASAISKGIFVNLDVSASNIFNTKDIKSTAEATATTTDSRSVAYGIYLNGALNSVVVGGSTPTYSSSTLENSGFIDVKSTSEGNTFAYSEGLGIYVDNLEGSSIINGVENGNNANVKIKVVAEATATGINGVEVEARGIDVNNFKDSEIKNYGTIEVIGTATSLQNSSVQTYGISAYSSEGDNVNLPLITTDKYSILNEGTIIVKSNAIVTDTTDGEINAEAYGISAYHDIWIDAITTPLLTIDNKGTVEAYINNKLDEYAYSMQVGGARNFISATNSGTLRGNIDVNGTLTNSGTIELPHNATASIANYTNEGTGKLIIGLSSDGIMEDGEPVFTHSKLETSNATFENGSTIDVNVLTALNNQTMLKGQILKDVVKADTALTINGTLNVTDNSALLNFKYATTEGWQSGNAGAIDLVIEKGQTVSEAVSKISTKAAPTEHKNAHDVARALDKIIDDSSNHPEMSSVITKLNQLSTNEEVATAVESTTPQSTTSSQTASAQISSNIANVVMQRQNPNFNTISGTNSGDEVVIKEKNLWIKPFGSIGSQANKDGINGFDVKSYGIGMGFDGKNKNDQMLGFGLFFTDANVDMNNVSQETDLKAYSAMMYGSLPVIDDKTNFLYQVGYSLQKTDSTRNIFTGDIATADFTSKMATIDTRLVRDYQLNKNLIIQPLVFATYRNFKTPSYSETGAGAINLDVEKSSTSEMVTGLGAMATYKLTPSDKLSGSLNAGYDLKDDKNSIVSSYQGASGVNFETQGIDNGRWSYEAGIGYEKTIDTKNSININYNFQAEGTDYKNNVVSTNYIYKF